MVNWAMSTTNFGSSSSIRGVERVVGSGKEESWGNGGQAVGLGWVDYDNV